MAMPQSHAHKQLLWWLVCKKKITLSTVSISFLTLIRLSLPNIFVLKT
jgi:hypothetical protein